METKTITFDFNDEIRLKRIALDGDRDDALDFAKVLLERITASANRGLKNHLDK